MKRIDVCIMLVRDGGPMLRIMKAIFDDDRLVDLAGRMV